MGFWSGFAQGWEAESERIERRKLFQQEQREKRVGTLAELISRGYGASAGRVAGAGESDATPASAEHYMTALGKYGMSADDVARINSEGGAYGLKAALDVIQENEGMITPELLTRIPDAIVVTQREGGQVDARTISDNIFGPDFYGELEPEDQAILELTAAQASQAQAPYVTTTLNIPEPVKPETINQTVTAANNTIMDALVARQREFERMAKDPANAGQQSVFIGKAKDMEALQAQVKEGNVLPAIDAVGAEIIGPYLENNPQLKANPELLGSWSTAAKRYLEGAKVAEQPAQIPVGTVDVAPDGSEWEFMGGDPADPANWKRI